jgi:hypothetical protein
MAVNLECLFDMKALLIITRDLSAVLSYLYLNVQSWYSSLTAFCLTAVWTNINVKDKTDFLVVHLLTVKWGSFSFPKRNNH